VRFSFLILFVFIFSAHSWSRNYSADDLFDVFSSSIYQVKIIDVESGSQSSIGSGFVVLDGYSFATNYHVISSLVHQPAQYRAEILRNGVAIELVIDTFDIVHDLAVLVPKDQEFLGQPLVLSSEPINKGKPLFSIGNPHDIGMTVVEGTYNGLVEHQFIDLIHFSGSINPGMSGGPVINTAGHVVGINVATSGDQIGFLVPVQALQYLLERRVMNRGKDFMALIQEQVGAFTDNVIDDFLASSWQLAPMGDVEVLGALSSRMECWGDTDKDEEGQIDRISKGCSNNDTIYIERGFNTGTIAYEFEYQRAYDWHTSTFYQTMTNNLFGVGPGNRANEDGVDNYQCKISVVHDPQQNMAKKVNYCVRPYTNIKGLFDAFYLAASIDKKDRMLIEHYTLSGITQSSASRFLNRFIGGAAAWQ